MRRRHRAPTVDGAAWRDTPSVDVAIVGAMFATTVALESAIAYATLKQPTLRALAHQRSSMPLIDI